MKKFVLGLVAASLVATPMVASAAPAPQHRQQVTRTVVHQNHNGRTVVKQTTRTNQFRAWRKGERFDSRYARNYRQIDYRQFHGRLKAPPRGYHYVQSGNDAVLVGITSGIVAAVFANLVR